MITNANLTSSYFYFIMWCPIRYIQCESTKTLFGEFGVYDIDASNCQIKTMVEPVNEYLAILYCVLILLALGFIYHAFKWAEKKKYTANMIQLYKIAKQKIGYEVK